MLGNFGMQNWLPPMQQIASQLDMIRGRIAPQFQGAPSSVNVLNRLAGIRGGGMPGGGMPGGMPSAPPPDMSMPSAPPPPAPMTPTPTPGNVPGADSMPFFPTPAAPPMPSAPPTPPPPTIEP